MDVDLDVVATREQPHQLVTQDDGVRVVECAAGVVGRLVQPRRGGVPGQSRPQGVDHLFAVQPPVAGEREELHELCGLPAPPDVRRHGYAVAGHAEAAEKLHLDAHRGTLRAACWSPARCAGRLPTLGTSSQVRAAMLTQGRAAV